MQSVNEIHIVCCNDEVCYGPEEGQSNITEEMRARWGRVFGKVEEVLETCGITPEEAMVVRDDNFMLISLDEEFSFEDAIAMLQHLEDEFKVTLFEVDNEYDEWNETNPHVLFGVFEQ